jgi:lipopolysaccharide transport system ATP-binding protein
MNDLSEGQGRTVLYVSHNMSTVANLCNSGVVMEKGNIIYEDNISNTISEYLRHGSIGKEGDVDLLIPGDSIRRNSLKNSLFKWTRVQIINSEGVTTNDIKLFEPFTLVLSGTLTEETTDLSVGFGVMSGLGYSVFNSHSIDGKLRTHFSPGVICFKVFFSQNILAPGQYVIDVGANGTNIIDWIPEAISLTIHNISSEKEKLRNTFSGVVFYPCYWDIAIDY